MRSSSGEPVRIDHASGPISTLKGKRPPTFLSVKPGDWIIGGVSVIITAVVSFAPILDSSAREKGALEVEKLGYEVETLKEFAPSKTLKQSEDKKTEQTAR